MLIFPDPNVETEYTDPNGSVWAFNGTGWVRQCDCDGSGGVQVSDDNPYGTYKLWRHGYPDVESQTQDHSNDSEPLGDNQ